MNDKFDAQLCLSAQRALYGAVGPHLVRFTGEIRDKTIILQWIVLNGATEDEIEDYSDVAAVILGDYFGEDLDEQLVKVARLKEAESVPPLNNHFFCRNLLPEYD